MTCRGWLSRCVACWRLNRQRLSSFYFDVKMVVLRRFLRVEILESDVVTDIWCGPTPMEGRGEGLMSETQVRTALITGATGFVGSHLSRRLVRDGWQVHVIVRPESCLEQLREAENAVVVHRHDGTTEGLLAIVEQARPEIVFHLASLFISEHQLKDVAPLIASNLLFGTQLLEAMKQVGVTRLVNTGTSWQHYQDEDYNPVNLYAATKQAFEDIVRYYLETTELKAITLKLFDTYGPDDPRPKLMNLLKRAAESGEVLAMSPGEQLVDLVYVDDVVEAFVVAAKRLTAGLVVNSENYALSSGKPISLRTLISNYCRTTDKHIEVVWGGRHYRNREVMLPWGKGTKLPNWEPLVNIDKGLSDFNK